MTPTSKGQNEGQLFTQNRFIKTAKLSFFLIPISLVVCIYILQKKDQSQEHQHLNHKLGGTSVDSVKDTDERLRAKYPGCFSKKIFKEMFNKKNMVYSLLGRNSTESIRYNHLCPYIKSRYNCATKNPLKYGENPTDWKLTLKRGSDQCNLWNFIHDLGGPIGVADRLIQRQYQHVPIRKGSQGYDTLNVGDRPFNVVLFGNSYLRQIFEALICSWFNDISYVAIQKGSHFSASMAFLNSQPNEGMGSISLNMTGDMKALPHVLNSKSCRAQDIKEFYNKNVLLPHVCKGYDDNIAVVEFGKKIRFHYLFRPFMHGDQIGIFDEKFDLNPKDVDLVLINDGQEQFISSELKHIFESSKVWEQRIEWPGLGQFHEIQQRDIGRWFGAINPWITDPPDAHGCMPGVPDDEVNLLLYLIFSNGIIRD